MTLPSSCCREVAYPTTLAKSQVCTPGGASLDRPESLLKSALEKVVFFECRLDQLSQELSRANEEIARLKGDLGEASRREVALRQELAAAEARVGEAQRDRDEALDRVRLGKEERERFMEKLIEGERIRQAGEDVEGLDLAAFIAELRAEVMELRAAVKGQPLQVREVALSKPPGFDSTETAAESMQRDGRLGITDLDREALRASARFETRTEETLFSLSLRELSQGDEAARLRAAQRLKAIGPRAASPAIAAALNAEASPAVSAALLEVLAAAGDASVLPLVKPQLKSAHVDVRLAALETAFRLGALDAIGTALEDGSSLVRRRAAVLATHGGIDGNLLERASRDGDASVRRVAVLGLGSLATPAAERALFYALDDADHSVRRAAARGLSRTRGAEVFAIADLDASRRKREIRRVQALPAQKVSLELEKPKPAPVVAPAPVAAAPVVAVAALPHAPPVQKVPSASPVVAEEVLAKVYAALRGRTAEDLSREIAAPAEVVVATASALEQQGRLVRRGQRYFVP